MGQNASYARFENNPVRQAAYQLWALDPSKPVTELMPAIQELAGDKVALRTVQDWRNRDQWEVRYAEEQAAQSAVLVIEHVRRMRVAAPVHVSYLDAVARGDEPYDHNRVQTAKFLVTEAGRLLSTLPAVVNPALPDGPASLDALTTEELLALTEQRPDGE